MYNLYNLWPIGMFIMLSLSVERQKVKKRSSRRPSLRAALMIRRCG